MPEDFHLQKWDTDFFGFRVVKTKKDYLLEFPEKKVNQLYKKNIKLIVFNSSSGDFDLNNLKNYDILKVCTRIPILKEVKLLTPYHPNVSSFENSLPNKELISLARLSGLQGRFGQDLRFSKSTYNKIFAEWITNSVKRIAADDVLVYKVDGKIIGFGTVKIAGDFGYAPLFAVNRDFEGKGVSYALMRAIENRLIENECKYLISGTQLSNKKALTAFKRFGMRFQAPEYIYHLWKKD